MHRGHSPRQAQFAQRVVIYGRELYRVPSGYDQLRIRAGIAYITQAGQDHILHSGQEMPLDNAADIALVSGVKGEAVILEFFEQRN